MEQPTESGNPPIKAPHRYGRILLVLFCCWYGFLNFGGDRTPDEEVVFRTGQSLATHGTFAVEDLKSWPGCGTARGIDGNRYSIFGPLQSIMVIPFIVAAKAIDATGWYNSPPVDIPVSTYVGTPAHPDWSIDNKPLNMEPHALRFLASFFNALIGSLLVYLFFKTAYLLVHSKGVSFLAAILFGAGTLAQPYAGAFYSEPLTTLFALWSAYCLLLIAHDHKQATVDVAGRKNQSFLLVVSGLTLGLSTATHITGVLFAPFFLWYLLHHFAANDKPNLMKAAALWLGAFAVILLLLGIYNYMRFGNILETGRNVDPNASREFGYGYFVAPWFGLFGLTLGFGKGLLWFSPAILLSIPGWRLLLKKDRPFAACILACSVMRLFFIASRFDWPGAFCPGPRYLMPLLPFLLLPFAFWLDDVVRRNDRRTLLLAIGGALFCILEQWYLSLGDTIVFYIDTVRSAGTQSGALFKDWAIYIDAAYSPLFHALSMKPTPFMLHGTEFPTALIFFLGALFLLMLCAKCYKLSGLPPLK